MQAIQIDCKQIRLTELFGKIKDKAQGVVKITDTSDYAVAKVVLDKRGEIFGGGKIIFEHTEDVESIGLATHLEKSFKDFFLSDFCEKRFAHEFSSCSDVLFIPCCTIYLWAALKLEDKVANAFVNGLKSFFEEFHLTEAAAKALWQKETHFKKILSPFKTVGKASVIDRASLKKAILISGEQIQAILPTVIRGRKFLSPDSGVLVADSTRIFHVCCTSTEGKPEITFNRSYSSLSSIEFRAGNIILGDKQFEIPDFDERGDIVKQFMGLVGNKISSRKMPTKDTPSVQPERTKLTHTPKAKKPERSRKRRNILLIVALILLPYLLFLNIKQISTWQDLVLELEGLFWLSLPAIPILVIIAFKKNLRKALRASLYVFLMLLSTLQGNGFVCTNTANPNLRSWIVGEWKVVSPSNNHEERWEFTRDGSVVSHGLVVGRDKYEFTSHDTILIHFNPDTSFIIREYRVRMPDKNTLVLRSLEGLGDIKFRRVE